MRFLPVLIAATAAVTAQSPLTTTFAGGNGQSGNMFEVVATNAAGITITNFEVNSQVAAGGVGDFEVYTLAGNYAGNENNAAAWTLVGAATGVTCNGAGVATLLPVCVDTYVAPGTTQSFYVTHSDTNIVAYTNGTAAGAVYASNADLEFYEGSGHAYPFAANFTPRIWNGNIAYSVGNTTGGAGCTFAAISSYGAGCGGSGFASFYEQLGTATMDLDGSIITGLNTGAGYLVQAAPGAGGVTPGLNATVLALGDDDFQDSGGSLGVWVGSNGNIALGGANSNGFTPDVNVMLSNAFEGLYAWTDLHSASGGGAGDIFYEENGSEAIVTYLGVSGWNVALPNTIQFKWDTLTGNFSIEFDGLNTTNPEDWLVGYSQAGQNIDPGAYDLSTLLPANGGNILLTQPVDAAPLQLDAGRPILGSNWDLTTNYIDPVSPIAITFLGDAAPAPVPFVAIGLNAPGCDINLATTLGSLTGLASAGSATVTLPIANNPALAGFQLSAQSISLSSINAAGLISSNGVTGSVGN